MTLHERLIQARTQLEQAGLRGDEARVDVSLFARTILGWDAARLITESDADVPAGLEPRFTDWVSRRARHEPSAYIVENREFWGLPFRVTPAVLIPRPETEMVVEEILKRAGAPATVPPAAAAAAGSKIPSPPTCRVADIGTGSGNIAVSAAHSAPHLQVVATDVSAEALAVARENARRHGVEDRIEFYATSYLGGVEGDFDIIAANPPYVRTVDRNGLSACVRHEPDVALFGGDNGLLHIDGVLATAVHKLRRHGWLIMEMGFGQEDDVRACVARYPALRFDGLRHDLQGLARTVIVQKN